MGAVQLDISRRQLSLLSEGEGGRKGYRLLLGLAYPVDDTEGAGSAKWQSKTQRLTVTLPVLPMTSEEIAAVRAPLLEAQKKRDHVCLHRLAYGLYC